MAEDGQFNTTATAAAVDVLGYSCRCSALCSQSLVIHIIAEAKAVIDVGGRHVRPCT